MEKISFIMVIEQQLYGFYYSKFLEKIHLATKRTEGV